MSVVVALGGRVGYAQYTFKVGMKVVTKNPAGLQIDGKVLDGEKRHRVYTITAIRNGCAELSCGSIQGRSPTSDLVPFDNAIDYFTEEIFLHPGWALAYGRRGIIWNDKGEYLLAISDYSESIRLDPNDPIVWANRGNSWAGKKEYDKAIADYTESIRLDPEYAYAFYNRGNSWADKKEYGRAIADYNEAIRLDPDNALAFNNRGNTWLHKQEYDRAIADCDEAIRLDPKHATAFNNRGAAWANKAEYDKAIANFDEAIRLDPKYAHALVNRGVAWNTQKEYDKAIADLNEALWLDPRRVDSYNLRAWIWATCPVENYRDGKRAIESALRACELTEWKTAYTIGTLAAAYAESGDFEKAVEYQEKAMKLYTDDEDRQKGEKRLALYKAKKPYRDEEEE